MTNPKQTLKLQLSEIRNFVNKTLSQFQQELIGATQRHMHMWNVANAMIRLFGEVGIEQGWWKDLAEFNERFAKTVVTLTQEATEEQKARLAQILEDRKTASAQEPS